MRVERGKDFPVARGRLRGDPEAPEKRCHEAAKGGSVDGEDATLPHANTSTAGECVAVGGGLIRCGVVTNRQEEGEDTFQPIIIEINKHRPIG